MFNEPKMTEEIIVECPVSFYAFKNSLCVPCSRGQYKDSVEGEKCDECPNGKYQPNFGSKSCKSCPRFGTTIPGATSIQDCSELWETFQGILILSVSGLLTVCLFAFIYMRCGEMCCPCLFKTKGVQSVRDKAALEKRNQELKGWQDKQKDPAVNQMFGSGKKKGEEGDMYPPGMYPPEMMMMGPPPDMMMMGSYPPPPFMPPPPMMPPPQ